MKLPALKPVSVGLLGIGTVGGGTFAVLLRNQEEIARRAGCAITMRMVADKDIEKARHLGIRLAGAVPQIVALGCAAHDFSFSRSNFMPRCRFTRTEAGVSPVCTAISGPVSPSTSRRIKVSR